MTTLLNALLIVGLLFPVLSVLTGLASLLDRLRKKKYSSPVFVPFIGPLFLTLWVCLAHMPLWLIPVVWIADIGTVVFLSICPRIFKEWWQISCFTRILILKGSRENQDAVLTLHSTGCYLLKKTWRRAPGEFGIASIGEPGTYTGVGDHFKLTSYLGLHRVLQSVEKGVYNVEESELPSKELLDYSLRQWEFRAET